MEVINKKKVTSLSLSVIWVDFSLEDIDPGFSWLFPSSTKVTGSR